MYKYTDQVNKRIISEWLKADDLKISITLSPTGYSYGYFAESGGDTIVYEFDFFKETGYTKENIRQMQSIPNTVAGLLSAEVKKNLKRYNKYGLPLDDEQIIPITRKAAEIREVNKSNTIKLTDSTISSGMAFLQVYGLKYLKRDSLTPSEEAHLYRSLASISFDLSHLVNEYKMSAELKHIYSRYYSTYLFLGESYPEMYFDLFFLECCRIYTNVYLAKNFVHSS